MVARWLRSTLKNHEEEEEGGGAEEDDDWLMVITGTRNCCVLRRHGLRHAQERRLFGKKIFCARHACARSLVLDTRRGGVD